VGDTHLFSPMFSVLMLRHGGAPILRLDDPARVSRRPARLPGRILVAVAACSPIPLLVALAIVAGSPLAPRWIVAIVAAGGLAASCLVAAAVAAGMTRSLAALERQRDAFYQEMARLSKAASLGEISSSIAHDLNNPLAIINEEAGWLLDLLEGRELDQEPVRREFESSVAQIRVQIKRASEFTRRLLSWTRDADRVGGPLDLNLLLSKTLYLVENELAEAGVTVVKRLDPGLPGVAGNEAELRQVFLHLMKNALDAMKGAGGTLTISTEVAGGAVRASVADTGTGIPPEILGRIFEPFFTTKPEGYGSGLGLPISAWIVERAGGRIEVESVVGEGTMFRVTLRAATAPRAAAAPVGGTHEDRPAAARG